MKKTILLLLLFSGTAFAQEDTTQTATSNSIEETEEKFEYNVFKERIYWWQMEKNWKISPFEIMSAIPTFGVDLETRMTPKLSFQYGAAFVPSYFQFFVREGENGFNSMNGYKLRFESRAHLFKKPNRYFATELSFRHLIINDDVAFGQEGDGNGNFAFFTTENVTAHRLTTQLNLKLGINKVYENGFVVDFYGGFSLRRNNVVGRSLPTAEQTVDAWNPFNWTLTRGHNFTYITPIIGLKFGFNRPAKKNL